MKRILIFSHALEIGGAERALLGLLETIDTKNNLVDLFLMRHEGELLKYIPSGINILPEKAEYASLAIPISAVLKKGQMGMAVGRSLGKMAAKKRVKKLHLPKDNDVALQLSHKYTLPFVPKVNDVKYDLAISFLTPHYFVAGKVTADKKIAWIHTDYKYVAIDTEEQRRMWGKYDWIASISENVTASFLERFPEFRAKIRLLPNIMPEKFMGMCSDDFSAASEMPDTEEIKLLSIGRFCNAKNFDQVPSICQSILECGVKVKWYLIGYGHDEMKIRNAIAEHNMQESVIILGKKENPYPYIKACDFYVQPSRYEGKCMAVIEAQMLHKPVIITEYSTSGSQLKNGVDGVIVPMNNEECAKGIAAVISDKKLRDRLIENTKKTDYSNSKTAEDLLALLSL